MTSVHLPSGVVIGSLRYWATANRTIEIIVARKTRVCRTACYEGKMQDWVKQPSGYGARQSGMTFLRIVIPLWVIDGA
jgi:hypothetical protein